MWKFVKKSQTSCEQVTNKLWTSCDNVLNKLWVVSKWTSPVHDLLRRSYEQVIKKIQTSNEQHMK